jgi:hypothetical protein
VGLFAVFGDVHGRIDGMVELGRRFERAFGAKLDLVLQVGDLEPHRDERDLATMSAPEKYRKLGDFPRYATGESRLPWEVVFIAGNHEPYGWLEEHPSGGYLIPGLYYLGRAGAVERLGLRIGGFSGVYHPLHSERDRRPAPSSDDARRWKLATYSTREDEARALALGSVDLLLLHDWPEGLLARSDANRLPTLESTVGSPRGRRLVEHLAPRIVFCGHLHVPYARALAVPGHAPVPVHALANVEKGEDSVAFVRARGKELEVLPSLGEIEAA